MTDADKEWVLVAVIILLGAVVTGALFGAWVCESYHNDGTCLIERYGREQDHPKKHSSIPGLWTYKERLYKLERVELIFQKEKNE